MWLGQKLCVVSLHPLQGNGLSFTKNVVLLTMRLFRIDPPFEATQNAPCIAGNRRLIVPSNPTPRNFRCREGRVVTVESTPLYRRLSASANSSESSLAVAVILPCEKGLGWG